MPGFSLKCPECGTTLKTTKPVTPGKVITCPKCEVMFAAPKQPEPKVAKVAAVEAIDDVEYIDDVEIIGESNKPSEPAKSDRPKGGAPRARRGRSKRQKMSTLALVLLLSGVVVGVGALGVGGLLIWKYVLNAPSDLAGYVPDDAPVIMGANIGRIMSDTSLVQVIDFGISQTPVSAYFRNTNTVPKLVFDRAIVVIGKNDEPTALSILTKSVIDKEKLTQAISAKPATFAGRDAFRVSTGPSPANMIFPTPKSLSIVDANKSGEQIAESIGKFKPSADITAMITKASAGDIWMVFDYDSHVFKSGEAKGLPAGLGASMAAQAQAMRCAGLWLRFGQLDAQLTLHMQLRKGSSVQVDQMTQDAKKAVAQFTPMIDTFAKSPMLPPQAQHFLPMVGEILNSLEFSSSGDCVIVKAKTKSGLLEKAFEEVIRGFIPSPRGR